jgi:tripartite-type tricarboxylate transporter receptor subunit TctC
MFASPVLAADYYAGKTIKYIVGADVGGGYDIYSRTITRHLPKHIPGNPTIVVQNMPGAGSGKAATYMQTVAPKDGTVIAALMPGAVIGKLLDDKATDGFDPTKFSYLATADSGTRVCVAIGTSKIKTFADAQTMPVSMGASQSGGSTVDYAAMTDHAAGAKIKIVSGYKGTAEIGLAMERGEVDGLCGWDWASLKSQKPDWVRDNKVNILVQFGAEPEEELTKMKVPTFATFIKDPEVAKAVKVVVSQQTFGRPYVAPPGTPPELVKILRDAFIATLKDPAFLEDAKKARIDITASSGEKVQSVVEDVYASPPDVIARAKALIKP